MKSKQIVKGGDCSHQGSLPSILSAHELRLQISTCTKHFGDLTPSHFCFFLKANSLHSPRFQLGFQLRPSSALDLYICHVINTETIWEEKEKSKTSPLRVRTSPLLSFRSRYFSSANCCHWRKHKNICCQAVPATAPSHYWGAQV